MFGARVLDAQLPGLPLVGAGDLDVAAAIHQAIGKSSLDQDLHCAIYPISFGDTTQTDVFPLR